MNTRECYQWLTELLHTVEVEELLYPHHSNQRTALWQLRNEVYRARNTFSLEMKKEPTEGEPQP